MSLVTGIQPAEFIFVSSLQTLHKEQSTNEQEDKHDMKALARRQDFQTAVTNKLQKKTLFQNCIRK